MLIYVIPSLTIYFIYYFLVTRRSGAVSIDNIFIISQFIMLTGSLLNMDSQNSIDIEYAKILSYTLPLFMVGSMVGEYIFNRGKRIAYCPVTVYRPQRRFYVLIAFSILITILYYISVGYNVLFLGISAIFSGETYDIATLRLESYSSSRYLFPGYVNQFKNSILPISSVILIYYLYSVRHKYRGAIAGTLGLMSLIGLLGTGQRGAFVVFVLVVLCFTYYISRITFFRALRTALLVGIPIFFLSSIVLDRNNTQDTLATDPIQTVTVLGRELGNRIFSDNQITSIVGYRYVSFLPTAHGEEWGQAILGLLPGESFRGSDLSGQIFKILYGNDRGTAPIGLWGSVFYNFGTIGLVVFPLLFGAFLRGIFSYFSRNTTLNTGQIAGIAGVFVTLGTWVSDGPVTVLNTGALAYLFIYFICTPKTRPKYNG